MYNSSCFFLSIILFNLLFGINPTFISSLLYSLTTHEFLLFNVNYTTTTLYPSWYIFDTRSSVLEYISSSSLEIYLNIFVRRFMTHMIFVRRFMKVVWYSSFLEYIRSLSLETYLNIFVRRCTNIAYVLILLPRKLFCVFSGTPRKRVILALYHTSTHIPNSKRLLLVLTITYYMKSVCPTKTSPYNRLVVYLQVREYICFIWYSSQYSVYLQVKNISGLFDIR